jgi:predicted transcriptional regulator
MTNSNVITARVDDETLNLVDKVARAQGRSRAWFAARAIEQVARSEAELLAFIQEGIDDIEAGRIIEHDDMMAELDAMIARLEARCAD